MFDHASMALSCTLLFPLENCDAKRMFSACCFVQNHGERHSQERQRLIEEGFRKSENQIGYGWED